MQSILFIQLVYVEYTVRWVSICRVYCSLSLQSTHTTNIHNFAQESPIEKIKVPFRSAINVFSGGVLISVSTKCGEWVVYTERSQLGTPWYRDTTAYMYVRHNDKIMQPLDQDRPAMKILVNFFFLMHWKVSCYINTIIWQFLNSKGHIAFFMLWHNPI